MEKNQRWRRGSRTSDGPDADSDHVGHLSAPGPGLNSSVSEGAETAQGKSVGQRLRNDETPNTSSKRPDSLLPPPAGALLLSVCSENVVAGLNGTLHNSRRQNSLQTWQHYSHRSDSRRVPVVPLASMTISASSEARL